MSTAARVLEVARTQLGVEELPYGSDDVVYNTWFYNREVGGGGYPWCAVFVSWVADQAGATAVIPRHAYTPSGAAWFQQRGQWSRTPAIGSVVYYQWPGMGRIGHVGIVEAVHADGSWTAIEGNTDGAGSRTGGRVMRQRRRSVGALGGFGHPAYSSTPTPTPQEDQMSAKAEQDIDWIRKRLEGRDVQRWLKGGPELGTYVVLDQWEEGAWPARSADVADIIGVLRMVQNGDARTVEEVSSAFHQTLDRDAAAQASLTAQVAALGGDPAALAGALKAALGEQLAADVAARLTVTATPPA